MVINLTGVQEYPPGELQNFVPIVSGTQLLGIQPAGEAPPAGTDPLTGATVPSPRELNRFGERVYYTRDSGQGKISGGVGGGNIDAAKVTVVQDSFLGKRMVLPSGGSAIYGACVRLKVIATDFNAALSLSLPIIAAEAQFGRATAQYEFEVIGYVPPDDASYLPKSGAFNLDMYVELRRSAAEARDRFISDRDNIKPEALLIELKPVGSEELLQLLGASEALIFALSRLARRTPRQQFADGLARAEEDGKLTQNDVVLAQQVYDKFAGNAGDVSEADSRLINLTYFAQYDVDIRR